MNVSLTSELESFVRGKVTSGFFQNASEVVRTALRLMKEKEEDREQQKAWLHKAVEQGLSEARAERLISASEAKAGMRDFKNQWRNGKRKDVQ